MKKDEAKAQIEVRKKIILTALENTDFNQSIIRQNILAFTTFSPLVLRVIKLKKAARLLSLVKTSDLEACHWCRLCILIKQSGFLGGARREGLLQSQSCYWLGKSFRKHEHYTNRPFHQKKADVNSSRN